MQHHDGWLTDLRHCIELVGFTVAVVHLQVPLLILHLPAESPTENPRVEKLVTPQGVASQSSGQALRVKTPDARRSTWVPSPPHLFPSCTARHVAAGAFGPHWIQEPNMSAHFPVTSIRPILMSGTPAHRGSLPFGLTMYRPPPESRQRGPPGAASPGRAGRPARAPATPL